jgi:hypothetical protein
MPNDALGANVNAVLKSARDYLVSPDNDRQKRGTYLGQLTNCRQLLVTDIADREGPYLKQLETNKATLDSASDRALQQDDGFQRARALEDATLQQFTSLQQEGRYPRNISPVLYVIPLLMIGVAEWYVNFATFSANFIPVFAISATIIVAAVFAWASHLHGGFLKQLSEILDPAVHYRTVLGRKIATIIATILLIAALATVVWLRWQVVSEQLGIVYGTDSSVFGSTSSGLIWSKVGPTIIVNILIWGLGTLYAWALHDKIPELRETYRDYLRASKRVGKYNNKLNKDLIQHDASFEKQKRRNTQFCNADKALLTEVDRLIERLSIPAKN